RRNQSIGASRRTIDMSLLTISDLFGVVHNVVNTSGSVNRCSRKFRRCRSSTTAGNNPKNKRLGAIKLPALILLVQLSESSSSISERKIGEGKSGLPVNLDERALNKLLRLRDVSFCNEASCIVRT